MKFDVKVDVLIEMPGSSPIADSCDALRSASVARMRSRPPFATNCNTPRSSSRSNHTPWFLQTSMMIPDIFPKFTRFMTLSQTAQWT